MAKDSIRRFLTGIFVLGLGTAGCASRLTDFTVISTKNVNLHGEKGKRVHGSSCGMFSPNMKDAIDEAIQSSGDPKADMLVDGVLSSRWLIFWTCYDVEGNIIVR